MMRVTFVTGALFALAACTSNDPNARAARQLEAAADNRGDMLEAAAAAKAGTLKNEADAIMANVVDPASYNGRVMKTRAEALEQEARIVREQGRAQAEAARSAGEAQADAIRAR